MNRPSAAVSHPGAIAGIVRWAFAGAIVLMLCAGPLRASEEPTQSLISGGSSAPHVDSWEKMRQSFEQFAHPEFLLRLLLGLGLAVVCASAVAWHPRRSTRLDPLSDLEERKAIILLGVVGAVIAELSSLNQTLALVIFGIGALLRFRTVLDNPKITGKAIMVVAIGLACGLGSWAMAVFVTVFTCALIYWLDSHVSCRLRVRLPKKADLPADLPAVHAKIREFLIAHHVRVKSSVLYDAKRQVVFLTHVPTGMDPAQLEADMRAAAQIGRDVVVDVRFE